MYIGTKIKEFRKKRNVTQEELARHIGVSIDALFDFHVQEAENAVRTIAEEAYRHREDSPAKGRKILEDGLKKYPDNAILLNNMLYVINYTEHPDETISVASALIEKSDGAVDKAIAEIENALLLIPILKNKAFDSYTAYFTKQVKRLQSKR